MTVRQAEAQPAVGGAALRHLDYLDGWRGVAIVTLLVGHFAPVPGLNLGEIGVGLFFVLSGLLMGRLLFVRRTDIGLFYRRRISRILPAHLAFIVVIALCVSLNVGPWRFSWREFWAASLFLNNYVVPQAGPGHAAMPYGHVWSLAVEEHGYVLMASLAWLARRGIFTERRGLQIALALCVLINLAYGAWNPRQLEFTYWLHSEAAVFGVLASACLTTGGLPDGLLSRRLAAGFPILMLAGVLAHWWSLPPALHRLLGLGLFVLALHLLPQAPVLWRNVLSWLPLRRMGEWSFSVYLWQQPFYLWVRQGEAPAWVGLAAAMTAGLISYYGLERPVRSYLNRGWARA
ncbi:acyltransferase [Pelomonas sp. KK5]|uniref:acyltransferase family protein n=1 Tax=Pelomonas sp. KK5 TaxID=1855730 RepID=UPI00097C315F|nr:acyltransferase [Pelomonas sp. KK5]